MPVYKQGIHGSAKNKRHHNQHGWPWPDNIFIERLWWTVKYHYLNLHSFENALEMRKGLRTWLEYYIRERSHQSLDGMTPDECYFKDQEDLAA